MQMPQESRTTRHPVLKQHHGLICLRQPMFNNVWEWNPQFGAALNPTIPLSVARKIFVLTSNSMLDDTKISLQQQLLRDLTRLLPKHTTWEITEGKSLLLQRWKNSSLLFIVYFSFFSNYVQYLILSVVSLLNKLMCYVTVIWLDSGKRLFFPWRRFCQSCKSGF